MSPRQRLGLAAAGVLVVVALAVAGVQRPGTGDPAGRPAFVSWLARTFGGLPDVPAADVTAGCPAAGNGGGLQVDGSCELTVRDPGTTKRLRLRSTAPLRVSAPGPDGSDRRIEADVAVGKTGVAETSIALDGPGVVIVRCSCVLRVGGGDD
ncbi:hypothetical protein [Cryptosporangium phraense]|uniref:Uncharacterized protein n=1 Tax=Cryptosporangium phraense TaxID=2593070 RepID=A0A545APY9_9ACTN|nr:hypothetical protein [Cryptosporangium phraense]TQS43389.1 hypothetical protein FL583_19340 [Cryptosporangium phraense]